MLSLRSEAISELMATPSHEVLPVKRGRLVARERTGDLAMGFPVDPLLRQGLVLTLSMALMNVANWLYHVVMSRALGPAGYGGLSALLGLLFIMTVPATTIQMGLSALVARREANQDAPFFANVLTRWLRGFLLFGLVLSSVPLLLSPWLADLLRLASPVPVLIAGTVLISWLPLPVVRGLLQGVQRFWTLGASFITEGLLKLGAGVLLVSAGLGLSGAVAAISLGALGALALTMLGLRSRSDPRPVGVGPQDAVVFRSLLPYVVAVASFTLLTQSDVVLVKILFPPGEAGVYAAASTAGKIILYLTAPLAMVMLPEAVRRHVRNEGERPVLLRSARYAAAAGGALVAAYILVPRPIMHVLFGSAYLEGAPLLWLVGLGMLANELALLGVYYLLGTGRSAVLRWVTVQALVFLVALWIFANSLETVAVLVAVAGLVTFGGVWWPLLRRSDTVLQPQRQAS